MEFNCWKCSSLSYCSRLSACSNTQTLPYVLIGAHGLVHNLAMKTEAWKHEGSWVTKGQNTANRNAHSQKCVLLMFFFYASDKKHQCRYFEVLMSCSSNENNHKQSELNHKSSVAL